MHPCPQPRDWDLAVSDPFFVTSDMWQSYLTGHDVTLANHECGWIRGGGPRPTRINVRTKVRLHSPAPPSSVTL